MSWCRPCDGWAWSRTRVGTATSRTRGPCHWEEGTGGVGVGREMAIMSFCNTLFVLLSKHEKANQAENIHLIQ